MINMKTYGLTDCFGTQAMEYPEYTVSRIVSQEKGLYKIVSENGEQYAEVSGKFRYEVSIVSEYPAVGDFVMVDTNNGNTAVIHTVLHRKSAFIRKAAGTGKTEQTVAANIDTLFLCMSLNNDFNLRRMERYLSIAWDSGAMPVIVLTKSDLCSDLSIKLAEIDSIALGTDVLVTSSFEEDGVEKVFPYIRNGNTIALIGSSGVGKSTLINRLLGEDRIETNGLRNDDKGRHTTTRRELIALPCGGTVIDTPGMRELGIWDSGEGVSTTFADVEDLFLKCRYKNCSHTSEPGCAVREAMEKGELSGERFASYCKLSKENEYAENSESYIKSKQKKFKDISKTLKKNRK